MRRYGFDSHRDSSALVSIDFFSPIEAGVVVNPVASLQNDEFKDWDASTGAFLPIEEPWVVKAAKKFLGVRIQVSLLK